MKNSLDKIAEELIANLYGKVLSRDEIKAFIRQACEDYKNESLDLYRNILLGLIQFGKDRGDKRDVILYSVEEYLKSSKF